MRRALTLLAVLVVLTAGCSGGGGSDDPIVAAASPATIDDAARSGTGYEPALASNATYDTSFTVTIQGDVESQATFRVTATVRRRVYRRSTPAGPATVALLSEPTVKPSEAFGSRFNPFGDRSPATLVANATRYAASGLERRGNRSVTVLGNRTTLATFEGTVSRDEGSMPATVGVATVRHGTDDVTVVVVTPREADERAAVDDLLAGIEH